MKPRQRQHWVVDYIQKRTTATCPFYCNVLDSAFVGAYIDFTGAPFDLQPFGADKCPQLGRDLSALYKAGKLSRYATGLGPGDASMGFPKWVYSYRLTATGKDAPKTSEP